MHQTILTRADRNKEVLEKAKLRFIRSSSSSLPPQVMVELETIFTCPVIEAYGMTEASHQMASNPLPDAPRKPGSVGIAAGPEVAIMSQDGAALLAPGNAGEIVIRGESVFSGYESNAAANAEAFSGDWFRTGDQGVMDEDGYISITGRLKEIINRGGEKISPREVDDILMDHPAVQQVVTFAIPHEKLGEEVAAAIVLRDGETASENDFRDFARSRLADFKVPRKVLILDEIPKGATGKLQRIGLATKLGLVKQMKICIFGAGAIGGLLGAKLSLAGNDVTLIARGPHLEAIQQNGLTVIHEETSLVAHPTAFENPEDAGPQDYVIITLKAHSVPGIADAIRPLLGPETAVVWGVNGVPWWYFFELDGAYINLRLVTVVPCCVLWD